MSNLVIVAIPADDEQVWELSSEKIPHLTLLFLGDEAAVTAEQAQRITEFMEHVVTMANMDPFYLDVDYRGTLGVDNADVLFFDKGWDSECIERIRNQLLQQNDIKTLHDAAPQFEGWTPHLTMGYPDSPAKKPKDGYSGKVHMVRFDRLAIWFNDFEGPEFRLKRERVEVGNDQAVAWSGLGETTVGDILEHHGVKGMKWGVRKNDSGGVGVAKRERNAAIVKNAAEKAKPVLKKGGAALKKGLKAAAEVTSLAIVANEDAKFEQRTTDPATRQRVHDRAAKKYTEKDAPRINSKTEYRNIEFHKDLDKMWSSTFNAEVKSIRVRNYEKEHADAFLKRLKESAKEEKNFSENRRYGIQVDHDGSWHLVTKPIKQKQKVGGAGAGTSQFGHSDTGEEEDVQVYPLRVLRDAQHLIVGIEFDEVAHAISAGEAFIVHYGVKGMHWGIRKDSSSAGGLRPFSATSKLIEKNRAAVEADRRAKRSPVDAKATDHIGPTKFNKTKIKTKGGEDHPAHEDALNVARVQQKLKKSGPAALSNKELRVLNERLQLEQNTARLVSERKSNGEGFVRKTVKRHGKQQVDRSVQKIFNQAGDKALEEAERRATEKLSNR